MKRTATPLKHRYEQVMQEREQVRALIIQHTGITELEYCEAEFNCGLRLIEQYFVGMHGVESTMQQLRECVNTGFWPFFRNLRGEWELNFWYAYRFVYQDDCTEYGQEKANQLLSQEWRGILRMLTNDAGVHERLRQFLISKKLD